MVAVRHRQWTCRFTSAAAPRRGWRSALPPPDRPELLHELTQARLVPLAQALGGGEQAQNAHITESGSDAFPGSRVTVIDTAVDGVVGTPINVGGRPTGLAITPEGRRAYVANGQAQSVSMIATASNSVGGELRGPEPERGGPALRRDQRRGAGLGLRHGGDDADGDPGILRGLSHITRRGGAGGATARRHASLPSPARIVTRKDCT